MRRLSLLASLSVGTVVAVSCTSTVSTPVPASPIVAPDSAVPSIDLPSIPPLPSIDLPSFSIPPLPSGGIPSFEIPSFEIPSFSSDEDLEARFPESIAGSPVTVQTLRATDFLQFFEDDPEGRAEFEAFISAIGVGPDAISIGIGQFEYEDSTEQLQALRAAGADGPRLLQALVAFTQQEADDPAAVETTTGTAGGKPVTILTDGDTTSYMYSAGDVVWLFESDDASLVDQVMGAIP